MFGLMGVARMSGQQRAFSPLSLFAASEQGAWYDPSDFSSMFQDSTGTTPVTAVEQPVGRINDKSGNGNHATQATAAARPVVSARVNLLTYTEDLSNAAWGKTGAVATTATRLTEDSSTGAHLLLQGGGVLLSQTATVRCAAGTRRYLSIWSGYAGTAYITYDLQTGLVTEQGAGVVSASCTASPLGGYNCSVSFSAAGALRIAMSNSGTAGWNVTYTGDGSSYLDIYSQQHELGSTATRYQRVTTASDYDTVGFPHYLAFDGVDDSLATAAIDFTVTNKMSAFVGYSLTSASLFAHIINLGNGLQGTLAGGFWIFNEDTPRVAFSYSNTLDSTSYTARSFNGLMSIGSQQVASALFDGDGTTYLTAIPYASNKPTSLLPSNDAGILENPSGTFGNLPFYLGRTFSSVLSGKIYQTVVLGRLASAAEINATEAYIASKSGVVL